MKPRKLFCLILVLMFIASGCKKKEPEPPQQEQTKVAAEEKPEPTQREQAKVEAEEKTTQPPVDKTTPGPVERPAGNPAPSFTLQDLSGNKVSLSDFKGKVVILDFWATWCPPCVMEIPHFIELYDQYKAQGFAMVGISLDRGGTGEVEAFVRKYKVNYPILMTDGQVDRVYGGIKYIPTTFVIDAAGNIRQKYTGYKDKAVFEADIKALLAEAEAPS
jgi:peroxiredoxin